MGVKPVLIVAGVVVVEGLRLFIPLDRLANEIQVISAAPFLYLIYKVIKHLHIHERKIKGGK